MISALQFFVIRLPNLKKNEIGNHQVEENDKVDNRQILKYQVKGKGEEIILIGVRICNKGKSTRSTVALCCEIITVNNRVI